MNMAFKLVPQQHCKALILFRKAPACPDKTIGSIIRCKATMLDDLLTHELEVIKSFHARALSWTATKSASDSASLIGASEEHIEAVMLHPHGAHSLEQIAIRSVINELNALCEFALQNTWRAIAKANNLPSDELVFTASRGAIEKALRGRGVDVEKWPRWLDVVKIKELSEGFKHRQRMQPFPEEFQKSGNAWRANRVVDPTNTEWITSYELTPTHARESIAAVEELLHWLYSNLAIGSI
jgi:hypothetical protein